MTCWPCSIILHCNFQDRGLSFQIEPFSLGIGAKSGSQRRICLGGTCSTCRVSTCLSAPAAVYTATTSNSTAVSIITNPFMKVKLVLACSKISFLSISNALSGPSFASKNFDTGPGRSFGNPIAIFFLILTGADIGLCTFIAVQYSPVVPEQYHQIFHK